MLGRDKKSISRSVAVLLKKWLILESRPTDKYIYEMLNWNFNEGCLFCGITDVLLDKHHYPIRKKDGWTETIKLCPNCHRKFHTSSDYDKILTIKKWKTDIE
jgi:hypothetical protein